MRLGIMCSGEGTNFENIVRYPKKMVQEFTLTSGI